MGAGKFLVLVLLPAVNPILFTAMTPLMIVNNEL